MTWVIRDGPIPSSDNDRDAVGWRWEIERGEENRRLLVEVSTQAMGVDPATLPDEARLAKDTQGQSAVESILDRDDPPGRISFRTTERTEMPYGGQRSSDGPA